MGAGTPATINPLAGWLGTCARCARTSCRSLAYGQPEGYLLPILALLVTSYRKGEATRDPDCLSAGNQSQTPRTLCEEIATWQRPSRRR